MAYTQEQLEKFTNKQLMEVVEKTCSFVKKSALKKTKDMINFILNPPPDKDLFQNASMIKLKEIAKKHSGYKASDYAKSSSKDKLIDFLISKGEKACKGSSAPSDAPVVVAVKDVVVEEKTNVATEKLAEKRARKRGRPAQSVEGLTKEDIRNLAGKNGNYARLKRIAADLNWNGKSWKKVELVEFLLPLFPDAPPAAQPVGRLDVVAAPVAPIKEKEKEKVEEEIELLEFPVSDEVIAKHSGTVDRLKNLLKCNGITTSLPRRKEDLIALFKKRRCSDKEFNCNDTEFCDLRNKLCNDLKLLRKGDKFPHLANGLAYLSDEGHGRFVGTKEAIGILEAVFAAPPPSIQEEKRAVVQEENEEVVVSPPRPVKQKTPETSPQQQQDESGISPININRLLDKPASEKDIQKAILHCLGLYHDIDKNDEVILRS